MIAPIRSTPAGSVVEEDSQTVAQVVHDDIIARVAIAALKDADANFALRAIQRGSETAWRTAAPGDPSIEAQVDRLRRALSHANRPGDAYDADTVKRLTFWREHATADSALAIFEAVAILERGRTPANNWRADVPALWEGRNLVTHHFYLDAPIATEVQKWLKTAINFVMKVRRQNPNPNADNELCALRSNLIKAFSTSLQLP
jgi:hypothetical protein